MQNNQNIHIFENLINNRQGHVIQVYALSNGTIENVTPSNWVAAFETLLIEKGGAIVVVSKEDNSDDLNDILNTYDGWLSSIFGESSEEEEEIEWSYYFRNNGDISQTAKFKTFTKGNMFIICGRFPDILVDMSAKVGWKSINNDFQFPSLMFNIIGALLQNCFETIHLLERDLNENIKKTGNYVLINRSYQEWYLDSRKKFLTEQSLTLYNIHAKLNSITSNAKCFEQDRSPNQVMFKIDRNIIRYEYKIAHLMQLLNNMETTLKKNRTDYFEAARWLFAGIVGTVIYIGVSIYNFASDKENKTKKDRLIASCTCGPVFIIVIILMMRAFGGWELKYRKFR